MTRQNYYAQRKQREAKAIDKGLVIQLVQAIRMVLPQTGGRKLLDMIKGDLARAGISLGRDRFFAILREAKLTIRPKPRRAQTTQSRHRFRTYDNIAQTLEPTGPHQLWCSDITYLRTKHGFVYLALIMDAYSRKIIGYDCSDSLESVGAQRALKQAMKQRPKSAQTVHHSDRGIQYCALAYTEKLKQGSIEISMTEENHCYENAMAERLNGILKNELGLSATFDTVADAKAAVHEAVSLYNGMRLHMGVNFRTPEHAHRDAWDIPAGVRAPLASGSLRTATCGEYASIN